MAKHFLKLIKYISPQIQESQWTEHKPDKYKENCQVQVVTSGCKIHNSLSSADGITTLKCGGVKRKKRRQYTADNSEPPHASDQISRSVVSDSLWPHGPQHARPPCPSPTPGAHTNSCPSSWWCHPAISSSVVPFSSYPQSLPASGSFSMSQLFASGGQSIGVSASTSVLPMNTQDWYPLGWTGWISLQSNGLSRVFFNTTVQKHQFFGTQLSSQSNSHIHTWLLEKQ